MLLRKKKYQEKLLVTTDQQLENLEKLTSDLEFAQIELKVLDGLKVGNEALKKVHEILTIDEIERVLDETSEGIEKQREIDAILDQQIGGASALTDEDEEDVLAELDELNKSTEERTVGEDLKLPDVPTDDAPDREIKPISAKKQKGRESEEPIALEA